MTIKISATIMAIPERMDFVPILKEKLGDVPVSIDTEHKGEWFNCKQAWRMQDMTADWGVVIQDDAVVCKDFYKRAEETILKGKEILKTDDFFCSFYYGKRHSALRLKEGEDALNAGYWVNSAPKWGVSICMPIKYIEEMIAFCDELNGPDFKTADDARIAKFVIHKKLKVFFPFPSIVDHRHGKSYVGDAGETRHCYKFIDDEE
jgi:hypothetical protein